jgi:guanylate kinase
VEAVQSAGKICVLDIDVQGVKQLKERSDIASEKKLVFVRPPSVEELRKRLEGRGTETEESLQRRLDAVAREIEYGLADRNFDIVITNDVVETAYGELRTFVLPLIQAVKNFNGVVGVEGGGGGDQ